MQGISDRVESLSSQVHRALSHAIVVGELASGSLQSVAKLAEELEVSRSPVREALISLADQGMVAFEPNRGVRVLQTTAHDLEEVFSLRLLLEVPATFGAAQLIRRSGSRPCATPSATARPPPVPRRYWPTRKWTPAFTA